jgi:hypothetical protein
MTTTYTSFLPEYGYDANLRPTKNIVYSTVDAKEITNFLRTNFNELLKYIEITKTFTDFRSNNDERILKYISDIKLLLQKLENININKMFDLFVERLQSIVGSKENLKEYILLLFNSDKQNYYPFRNKTRSQIMDELKPFMDAIEQAYLQVEFKKQQASVELNSIPREYQNQIPQPVYKRLLVRANKGAREYGPRGGKRTRRRKASTRRRRRTRR